MKDDFERYDEEPLPPSGRLPRRDGGFAIDLTGMGIRIAATVVVIGLGILIIYFALRPTPGEVGSADVIPPSDNPPVSEEIMDPLATFTPGATSTPPPLDEPTPAPTVPASEGAPATLAVGASTMVTGTNGLGVNLRQNSTTTGDIVQILGDDTPLTIVEGPVEGEGYQWWKVRLDDGTEGWVVQEYLASAP